MNGQTVYGHTAHEQEWGFKLDSLDPESVFLESTLFPLPSLGQVSLVSISQVPCIFP